MVRLIAELRLERGRWSMVRKWVLSAVIAALVVALVGIIWAKAPEQGTNQGRERMMREQMPVRRAPSLAGEHSRCTKTCTTVMAHYTKQFGSMKTHEGDRQCWETCWKRFGDRAKKQAVATEMKRLWMMRNARQMRINQCAQACWRRHHEGETAVSVAGYRSEPRPWAPGGMSRMMR